MPYEQFIFSPSTQDSPTLPDHKKGSANTSFHETEAISETRMGGGNQEFIEEVSVDTIPGGKSIFLVDTKAERNPFFSDLMTRGINKTLRTGGFVYIICNKNSYAKGTICDQCGYIPQCKQCDITISFHKPAQGDEFGMCHMCKSYYKTVDRCTSCKKGEMKTYGLGIQQVAEFIEAEHKIKPLIINSPTANSLPKIQKIREMAANTSVIIATSLITTAAPQQANKTNKKHIPGLTILLNADAPLALPDYEAAANCFHLIHDTITHSPFSNIIIQTQKPDHPTVRLACSGKVHEFEARNTERKKQHQYPPFGDVCVLMYKNEVEKNVFSTINKLYQELLYLKERQENNNQKKTAQTKDLGLTIYATPPLIYKAYNKYRYNIIIRGNNIRSFVENAFVQLKISSRGFKVDRQAREII